MEFTTMVYSETSLRPPKHVWAYGCYLLDSYIDSPNSPNKGFNLPLAAHPPSPPSLPFPLAHTLILATHDITGVMKNDAQNPAVLAS